MSNKLEGKILDCLINLIDRGLIETAGDFPPGHPRQGKAIQKSISMQALKELRSVFPDQSIVVVPEMGCAYRWSYEWDELEWCPIQNGGVLDAEEWGTIDQDIVGDEPVTYEGRDTTLSEVYKDVTRKLRLGRQ